MGWNEAHREDIGLDEARLSPPSRSAVETLLLKRQVVAASLGVAALLSGAAGARGQGAGRPTSAVQPAYQTLVEHGFRPALIYDAEGFADLSGGARRGA